MSTDKLDIYTAVGIAEGFIECDSEDAVIDAWQMLIDTGIVWTLQGYFGRTARALLDSGICDPAPNSSAEYDTADHDHRVIDDDHFARYSKG